MRGLNDEVQAFARLIEESDNTVVFTGAGISTASGIPDFRGKDGLWKKVNPMDVFSYSAFKRDPAKFYRFYRDRLIPLFGAKPNYAHIALAELENMGMLRGVITQNIDGLHSKAGTKNLLEIHGTVQHATCQRCGKRVDIDTLWKMLDEKEVPYCDCGGVYKIDVVLFEEPLPQDVWSEAVAWARECKLLIVIGSSLQVVPAAEIPWIAYESGAKVVIVNLSPTYMDAHAELVIRGGAPDVMRRVLEQLKRGG